LTKQLSAPTIGRLADAVQSHFRVDVQRNAHAIVLAVSGELDLSSSTALEEEIAGAIDSDASLVIVDLRGLEFIDSTGLGVLVKANQRALDEDRSFGLVRGGSQVQRLLSLTGLADRLKIADTPEELIGGD
jgi:anti-sigma B factor antagonist